MTRFANASRPPCRNPSIPARFAGSRENGEKVVGSTLCATSMTQVRRERERLAELSHEQLWLVCQRKPSDFEPYGQGVRSTASDCSCGCKRYHNAERTCLPRLGRLWQSPESSRRTSHVRASGRS